MFNILVVEDEAEKLKHIYRLLDKIEGIDIERVDHELDVKGAKKQLLIKSYDLLILDILLPLSKDQDIDEEGGIKLLDEILSRPIYKVPTHIFGLTGKEEIFENTQKRFKQSILTLVRYSQSDIEWETQLMAGIKQRILAKEASSLAIPDYDFDVAIICALRSELESNLQNGWSWKIKTVDHDDTIYHEAVVDVLNGKQIKIIAACAIRMGMPATGALTMKIITTFRPKFIVMTGIMAGVTGRVALGDLVIIDPSWDWGSGKWISDDEGEQEKAKSLFLVDPYQFTLDTLIKKEISLLASDEGYLFALRKSYGMSAPNTDLVVHIGAVASGASVLSDKETFNKIKDQHRKLLGVEMEAYALFTAAECASRPKPIAFCVKSVVDFGDSDKTDDYQGYGAFISSRFAKDLIVALFSNRN